MKFMIMKTINEGIPYINLEPQTERDEFQLQKLLDNHRNMVLGFGRKVDPDYSIGGVLYLQLLLSPVSTGNSESDEKVKQVQRELEYLQKKIDHGCANFDCPQCDGED